MRILIATSVHPPFDARIMREITSLVEAGHDCTLMAPWAGDSQGTLPFGAEFFRRHSSLRGRLIAYLTLLRLASLRRWDAIHLHDFDLLPAALLLRIVSWRRVVYDVHENYGDEVMVRSYIPNLIRSPLRWLVNAFERVSAIILGRAVVVVPDQLARFQRWGCRRVVLVRNFATKALAPEQPNDLSVLSSDRLVLHSGGQTVSGGAGVFLEASRLLVKRGFGATLAGIDRFDGEALRQQVRQHIADVGDRYALLPWVRPHELAVYLRRAAIGVSCNQLMEKRFFISTKLFEYMAFGIPIIATDVGYHGDIIRDSGAGLLIPPGDPVALADAIERLWGDQVLRRRLGAAGRAAFFARYCWEHEAERLLAFYRDDRGAAENDIHGHP